MPISERDYMHEQPTDELDPTEVHEGLRASTENRAKWVIRALAVVIFILPSISIEAAAWFGAICALICIVLATVLAVLKHALRHELLRVSLRRLW